MLNSGVIGNGASGQLRPQPRHRRARASAQRSHTPILWSGRASGPAVTPCSRCRSTGRAGVFAVWPAAESYGACWIGRHAIASGGGAGGANVRPPGSVLPTPPTYTGVIVSENFDSTFTLADANGKRIVLKRLDVEDRQASPKSLMPDDLHRHLTRREVLVLLAYFVSLQAP